jgi:hypothetical protein
MSKEHIIPKLNYLIMMCQLCRFSVDVSGYSGMNCRVMENLKIAVLHACVITAFIKYIAVCPRM